MKKPSEDDLVLRICRNGHKGHCCLDSLGRVICRACTSAYNAELWDKKHPRQPILWLEGEEWRPILGHEGLYEVSGLGRIRSFDRRIKGRNGTLKRLRGVIYKNARTKRGYETVMLVKDEKWKGNLVHRLVASAFIENRLNLPQVNHIDGNKTNNHVSNLEWVDNLTNHRKAAEIGLLAHGERHYHAKLSNKDVEAICSLFGKTKQVEIAKRFNISVSVVSSIKSRAAWRYIQDMNENKIKEN